MVLLMKRGSIPTVLGSGPRMNIGVNSPTLPLAPSLLILAWVAETTEFVVIVPFQVAFQNGTLEADHGARPPRSVGWNWR